MAEQLFETLRRLGIFMICAQTIVHFRPKEADEKYIRLLVSIMILIQLLIPVGSVVLEGEQGGEVGLKLEGMMEQGQIATETQPLTLDEVLQSFLPQASPQADKPPGDDVTTEEGQYKNLQEVKKGQKIEVKEIEKIEVGE